MADKDWRLRLAVLMKKSRRGRTYDEIAELANVRAGYIRLMERRELIMVPHERTIVRLARATKTNPAVWFAFIGLDYRKFVTHEHVRHESARN